MNSIMSFAEFAAKRQQVAGQFYSHPSGAKGNVLVSSHIWWTDQIAYAVYALGYNVMVGQPLYLLYTDSNAFTQFDGIYNEWVNQIKRHNISIILGGNSTAMAPHPKTGVMLHDAAGAKLVNYWWDEPRTCPPYARRLGLSPEQYMAHLRNEKTLNVIWDVDVMEELKTFHAISNTMHVPLATLPEHWPKNRIPLKQRPLDCCFLGNCHFVADYADTSSDPFVVWANKVIAHKLADVSRPMTQAMEAAGAAPESAAGADPWTKAFWAYEVLNAVYMHRTRNVMVAAAAKHLGGKLALIGAGWEKMGLRANGVHAGNNSGHIYATAKTSLNLFGGCVHGGMPLRPFDIAASYGLVVTHDNRELPDLFEPGKECLAFRSADQLVSSLDAVLGDPDRYESMVEAGFKRVASSHSWVHRIAKILARFE
jgi:hypothetical protein